MKFKVGDKVKVIGTNDKIGTIIDITCNKCLVEFNWGFQCFHTDELELANEITSELIINTSGFTISNQIIKQKIQLNVIPDRYIINKGATILFWEDGTKTIVKKTKKDKYDKRLGFLTAYFQKMSGMSKTKANKYLYELVEEVK